MMMMLMVGSYTQARVKQTTTKRSNLMIPVIGLNLIISKFTINAKGR